MFQIVDRSEKDKGMSGSAPGAEPWMASRWWFVLSAPLGVGLGAASGLPLLVAVLPVLGMYPAYVRSLHRPSPIGAFGLSLLWAAALSASVIAWTLVDPDSAGAHVFHAQPYRKEMLDWIRTGHGSEGDPRQFLPLHAVHFLLFAAGALVSGGLLGLVLGSVLMGYMSHYVGSVALLSPRPVLAVLAAWHPWSVIRVIGFVACGVALSLPLLERRLGAVHRPLLLIGLGLIVLDAALKAVLAEPWRRLLLSLI
jgi:hypothetical protein